MLKLLFLSLSCMTNLAKAWNREHWEQQALQKLGKEERPDQTSPRRLSAGGEKLSDDAYCVEIAKKQSPSPFCTFFRHTYKGVRH